MSDPEVRTPMSPTKSTSDLVDKVLAHVREGQPEPAAKPAGPPAFAAIEARTPPGPQAKPAPAPLKGPAAATPPKGPTADAATAAAKAAAMKAAAMKAAGGKTPAGQPTGQNPIAPNPAVQTASGKAAPPEAAMPPAAAKPAGPPTASALIDESAPWLPEEPERRAAFLQVFRYWHAQVRPEYAHKARPAFLFLVTALPVMVKARDDLQALNLWEPPGEHSRQARDKHSAWKRYCEFLPRATQALQELDDYRHLSLLTALDDLNGRVSKAEKKFREGQPTGRR